MYRRPPVRFPQNASRTSKRSHNTDNPVYVGIYRSCLTITPKNVMLVVAGRLRGWVTSWGWRGVGDCISCPTYVTRCVNLKIDSMLVIPSIRGKATLVFAWRARRGPLPGSYRTSYGAPRLDFEPAPTIRVPVHAIINTPQEKPL